MEKEKISSMHTDIKWIKENLIEINKSINGNGNKGIMQRLLSLENWRMYIVGGLSVVIILIPLILHYN